LRHTTPHHHLTARVPLRQQHNQFYRVKMDAPTYTTDDCRKSRINPRFTGWSI
jgi:hypothetical protein